MNRAESPFRTLSADRLTAALDEVGGSARPDYLNDIVAQARRTRQRPAWTFPERWLPMTIALRPAAVVPRAVVFSALLAALLAFLLISYLLAGASPSLPPVPIVQNGLIAFDANGDIDVANPDGSGQHALISGPGNQYRPAWSPDGTGFAYWSGSDTGNDWQLIVVKADGSQPVIVASGTLGTTGNAPAWSPDGHSLVYSARTDQTGTCLGNGTYNGDFCTSRIFVAAADGTGPHQVGDPTLDARSPIWSPDGSTIAFGGGNAEQGVHLYLMDKDGTNVRQLSDVRGTDWAFVRNSWSPDGTMIAGQATGVAGDQGAWDVWTIPVDGSAATNVGIHADGDEYLPSWAPDRGALAWVWNGHIVLQDVGAAPVDLPPPAGIPFWSADGKLLATTDANTLTILGLAGDVRETLPGATDWVSWQPLTVTP